MRFNPTKTYGVPVYGFEECDLPLGETVDTQDDGAAEGVSRARVLAAGAVNSDTYSFPTLTYFREQERATCSNRRGSCSTAVPAVRTGGTPLHGVSTLLQETKAATGVGPVSNRTGPVENRTYTVGLPGFGEM